ncbi:MAG: hypothetical protein KJ687_11770, partial [Proteobacteria bacterium]|nr:hypothetical protein [Pseudomonadota bacterium]
MIDIKALCDEKVIYSERLRYEISTNTEIETMRVIEKNDKKMLRVRCVQPMLIGRDGKKGRIEISMSDLKGSVVKQAKQDIEGEKIDVLLDISDVPEGNYKVGFKAFSPDGSFLSQADERDFIVFGDNPPWQGNKLGISESDAKLPEKTAAIFRQWLAAPREWRDALSSLRNLWCNLGRCKVPPPWTPLKVSKHDGEITVSCWNRKYVFGTQSLLPEAIYSGEANYLKSPIRLVVKGSDGNILPQGRITSRLLAKSGKSCEIETVRNIENWGSIVSKATIEYDGFMWFDLVMDVPASRKTDQIKIVTEMPLDQSSLLNSGDRDLSSTGKTPEKFTKILNYEFGPFWIGNEKGGLSFGVESFENWSNKDVAEQVMVLKKAGFTEVAINIIDQSSEIKS